MVFYTPVPDEYLQPPSDEERMFTEIPYGEATIVAEVLAEGVCQVVRVISSNPDDYLHPELQPGSQVMFMPVFRGQS